VDIEKQFTSIKVGELQYMEICSNRGEVGTIILQLAIVAQLGYVS
jgi:hypothetical protein